MRITQPREVGRGLDSLVCIRNHERYFVAPARLATETHSGGGRVTRESNLGRKFITLVEP